MDKKKIVMILLVVVFLVGAGIGTYHLFNTEEELKEDVGETEEGENGESAGVDVGEKREKDREYEKEAFNDNVEDNKYGEVLVTEGSSGGNKGKDKETESDKKGKDNKELDKESEDSKEGGVSEKVNKSGEDGYSSSKGYDSVVTFDEGKTLAGKDNSSGEKIISEKSKSEISDDKEEGLVGRDEGVVGKGDSEKGSDGGALEDNELVKKWSSTYKSSNVKIVNMGDSGFLAKTEDGSVNQLYEERSKETTLVVMRTLDDKNYDVASSFLSKATGENKDQIRKVFDSKEKFNYVGSLSFTGDGRTVIVRW